MKTWQCITADILVCYDASCWMYECLNYKKRQILRCVIKLHQRSDNNVQSDKPPLWAASIKWEVKIFSRLSTLLINPESMLLQIISQLGRKSNLSLEFPPTLRPRSRPQNSLRSDLTCKKKNHKKNMFSASLKRALPVSCTREWLICRNIGEND